MSSPENEYGIPIKKWYDTRKPPKINEEAYREYVRKQGVYYPVEGFPWSIFKKDEQKEE
jgi:hypothetical protein